MRTVRLCAASLRLPCHIGIGDTGKAVDDHDRGEAGDRAGEGSDLVGHCEVAAVVAVTVGGDERLLRGGRRQPLVDARDLTVERPREVRYEGIDLLARQRALAAQRDRIADHDRARAAVAGDRDDRCDVVADVGPLDRRVRKRKGSLADRYADAPRPDVERQHRHDESS